MKYPNVVNKEPCANDEILLQLFIAKEISYFTGHFPGTPILAGVAQVDWAIEYAQQYLGVQKQNFSGIKQLKFSQVILPDSTVSLYLFLQENSLAFKYFAGEITYASGKINLC